MFDSFVYNDKEQNSKKNKYMWIKLRMIIKILFLSASQYEYWICYVAFENCK